MGRKHITMLRVQTEAGLEELKESAQMYRSQAELLHDTLDGRILATVAEGLEIIAARSPAEIADEELQAALTATQFEQKRAMEQIIPCMRRIQGKERCLILRKKVGRDYRRLPPQPKPA